MCDLLHSLPLKGHRFLNAKGKNVNLPGLFKLTEKSRKKVFPENIKA